MVDIGRKVERCTKHMLERKNEFSFAHVGLKVFV